ncbi:MAG: hypothetical protein IPO45_00600 [Saprospiraceae bacterium]|jgi:hypothetical protein|uniref:hypothetical protein n=1 Tax=Candidatus Brachybacter algidus TaxID=2982024 RepID=UPI001B5B0209|nr:hypothetical protein [Candidatus Brachybacter algidus]MBP7306209.1 hypothetical protein [Saprospiraceae bacterium]MBK6375255.1 hypothetical protein [Candidatus Brachybacter algidus]MBK6449617.1 hypothetical protein [Candidatus Brachybacter algidus]MBK7604495.1 hypothetical protein [Candidatus Brachybacter algidus]MBK8842067.1 hypothetical protein [Candidatus Brachybacter algidus]
MVEIFKTNVKKKKRSEKVVSLLSMKYPDLKINFDLEDCDKILRIEGESFCPTRITKKMNKLGHKCLVLE